MTDDDLDLLRCVLAELVLGGDPGRGIERALLRRRLVERLEREERERCAAAGEAACL